MSRLKNMNKKLLSLIIFLAVLVFGAWIFKSTNFSPQLSWNLSGGGKFLLPLVIISALVDSINPCAFSILILTIAFLFSLGKLRSNILVIGLTYIAGLFLVYFLIGLGILQALHLFNTPHFMGKLGATLLIVLGLVNVINEIWPNFPIKLRLPHFAHQKIAEVMSKLSLAGAFILGGLVGLCEFPCTGGPYLMILGLLHDTSTYLRGVIYLVLYNLIFILPLVVILLIASNRELLDKVKAWQMEERKNMRLISGIIMILLGLLIFLI